VSKEKYRLEKWSWTSRYTWGRDRELKRNALAEHYPYWCLKLLHTHIWGTQSKQSSWIKSSALLAKQTSSHTHFYKEYHKDISIPPISNMLNPKNFLDHYSDRTQRTRFWLERLELIQNEEKPLTLMKPI
jgi:hypothetical protein